MENEVSRLRSNISKAKTREEKIKANKEWILFLAKWYKEEYDV